MRAGKYKASEDRIEGLKFIRGMAATARKLWTKACEFDGIDPNAQFVVFSDHNKFAGFYNRAITQYLEACKEYEAGGYVGVTIR